MIANDFNFISFKHIYREANFVAYKIAHLGHSVFNSSIWFNFLPLFSIPSVAFWSVGWGLFSWFFFVMFLFLIKKNFIHRYTIIWFDTPSNSPLKLKAFSSKQCLFSKASITKQHVCLLSNLVKKYFKGLNSLYQITKEHVPFVPHQYLTDKINGLVNNWSRLMKLVNTKVILLKSKGHGLTWFLLISLKW